jgi:ubiquinone/menaquinone biosynthesis C-methylase UbiE
MPTLKENKTLWAEWGWPQHGDEWSIQFGGTKKMWEDFILPRIREFLPATHLLEIAVGHGRVSNYLIPRAVSYSGIDIDRGCIAYCRNRFKDSRAYFLATDGMTIPFPDNFFNFVFSWDSLVHADRIVIECYIHELARVLKPGGAAFIHHTNRGAVETPDTMPWHVRDIRMTADFFKTCCQDVGLTCTQELIDWAKVKDLDCLSTVRKP